MFLYVIYDAKIDYKISASWYRFIGDFHSWEFDGDRYTGYLWF